VGTLLGEAAVHPGFAYATIFLLQLKVVWGMWRVRDMTSGDTASYFVSAHTWHALGLHNPLWSPLYLAYYGSFLDWTADAYRATIAHRLALVLGVSLLVLALMRRLLEPRIAWLAAAWWVVLPVNHAVLYEVHLFGVVSVLAASIVLLGPPAPWRPGVGLGILLAGCLFVRNEHLVAVLLFAAICVVHEVGRSRRGGPRPAPWRLLLAYGGPVAVCLLVLAGILANAAYSLSDARRVLHDKHVVNVCQIYAFGYQQRHTDWQKSPWVECHDLMTRTFGRPKPTMGEAVLANPRAMLGHFGWNATLIPNGLEALLFNRISGTVTPAYETFERSAVAPALGVLLALLYLGGAVAMARDWRFWASWLRARAWGWLALACVAVACGVVMVTQRPRPAYLFGLELGLQAGAGLCLQALLHRWGVQRWLAAAFPLVVAVLLVAVPGYYADAPLPPPRPVREMYRTLLPFKVAIQAPGTVIVTPGYGFEACAYLRDRPMHMCRSLDYYSLRREAQAAGGWWPLLAARGATMFYATEAVTGEPEMQQALAGAAAAGWEVLMRQRTERGERMLLRRRV
jgi:hypothetical protein